jgi:4-hydroxybenzoate polyprenyltransferase
MQAACFSAPILGAFIYHRLLAGIFTMLITGPAIPARTTINRKQLRQDHMQGLVAAALLLMAAFPLVTASKDVEHWSLSGVTSKQLSVKEDTGLAVATGGLQRGGGQGTGA